MEEFLTMVMALHPIAPELQAHIAGLLVVFLPLLSFLFSSVTSLFIQV